MELDGEFRRQRKDDLRFAIAARANDSAGGALRTYAGAGQAVADAEPRIFRAVLSLEERVVRAARAHEAGTDGRDDDAFFRQFRAQPFGEPDEGKLAGRERKEVGDGDLPADRGDVDDSP